MQTSMSQELPQEHYFTSTPSTDAKYRTIDVPLSGKLRTVTVANGVFSHAGLDKGTRQLLDHVPNPPAKGIFLDLGCGWGPIALTLSLEAPEATIWAVDPNSRARELTKRNAQALGCTNIKVANPDAVDPRIRFDLIWSNPPIRIGKDQLHGILSMWLPRLAPEGTAWLVVQKQLGADSLQRWMAEMLGASFEVTRIATAKGFRILRVTRLV